jgi:hypothetical protein
MCFLLDHIFVVLWEATARDCPDLLVDRARASPWMDAGIIAGMRRLGKPGVSRGF